MRHTPLLPTLIKPKDSEWCLRILFPMLKVSSRVRPFIARRSVLHEWPLKGFASLVERGMAALLQSTLKL